MKRHLTSLRQLMRAAGFFTILAVASTVFASNAAAQCLDLNTARNLVATGVVLPLGTIASMHNVQVYSAELCRRPNFYVYRLMVRGRGGRVMRVRINAQTGARM